MAVKYGVLHTPYGLLSGQVLTYSLSTAVVPLPRTPTLEFGQHRNRLARPFDFRLHVAARLDQSISNGADRIDLEAFNLGERFIVE